MSEQSKRNHEIINTHEVFEEEYIYKNLMIKKENKMENETLLDIPDEFRLESIKEAFDLREKIIKHDINMLEMINEEN